MTRAKLIKALKQRDEVLAIIGKCFLEHMPDEDNSWRVKHNLLELERQLEVKLFDYFKSR